MGQKTPATFFDGDFIEKLPAKLDLILAGDIATFSGPVEFWKIQISVTL